MAEQVRYLRAFRDQYLQTNVRKSSCWPQIVREPAGCIGSTVKRDS